MTTQIRAWLDNAVLQSVAESYLDVYLSGEFSIDYVLSQGVNHPNLNVDGTGATRLTDSQIAWFQANYEIVTHYANDPSGFSATLFRSKIPNAQGKYEYTLSFRSTEYQLAGRGGDYERDGTSAADGSIKNTGLAYAQLSSMEEFYKKLKEGFVSDGKGGWIDDPGAASFAAAQKSGAKLNLTGYSLGAHLATAFTLEHWADVNQTYTYNAAGVGVSGDHATAGATIHSLVDLYDKMMAWDGELREAA